MPLVPPLTITVFVTGEIAKPRGYRPFEEVEEAITGFGRDKDRKRLYTQRLFNWLMFIAFIQKKGWLKFGGDADDLAALWKAHLKDDSVSDKNFYRDRLMRLFFDGLNTTNEVNRIGINRGGFLKTLIGDVPYLNGGLPIRGRRRRQRRKHQGAGQGHRLNSQESLCQVQFHGDGKHTARCGSGSRSGDARQDI